jgi:hypothetical protein
MHLVFQHQQLHLIERRSGLSSENHSGASQTVNWHAGEVASVSSVSKFEPNVLQVPDLFICFFFKGWQGWEKPVSFYFYLFLHHSIIEPQRRGDWSLSGV